MKISIIVPIYNVELYLERCLDSIYKIRGVNKEIILVNDGSTDKSLEIARKYALIHEKETILITQENKGVSKARNEGLKVATGDYISFIDSDDYIYHEEFVRLLSFLKKKNVDILIGNAYWYSEKNIITNHDYYGIKSGKELFIEMINQKESHIMVWKNFYRKDFLKKNKIKFLEGILHEDIIFSFECFMKAKKVLYKNIIFYNYCERENSIIKTQSKKNIKHALYCINKGIILCEEMNIKNKEILEYLLTFYYSISRDSKVKNLSMVKKFLKYRNFSYKGYIKLFLVVFGCIYKKNINFENIVIEI